MQRIKSSVSLLVGAWCIFFLFPASADACVKRLTPATVQRGYTVTSEDGLFRVALWPQLSSGGITATVTTLPAQTHPAPDGMTLVSDVWVFDLLKADATTKDPLVLSKPLALSIGFRSSTMFRKRVFFWDGNRNQWSPLLSDVDWEGHAVRSRIRLPFAHIAVFEDTNAVEGNASWFRHRYGDTAASNDFPMGSRLRVTNLETKKSVLVTVRSVGPFVPGRVVDLANTAFQEIHPLWQGVTRVRVELASR